MSAAGGASHIEPMNVPIFAEYDGQKHANPIAAMPGHGDRQRVSLELPVRAVGAAAARVAARLPGAFGWVAEDGYTTEIRLGDGHLYRPLVYVGGLEVTPENASLSPCGGLYAGCYETEAEARAAVLREAEDLILIDGELWTRTTEPVLAVRGRRIHATIEPNEFETVFPLRQYQDAVKASEAVLDTSCQKLLPQPELLIPEVFSEPTAVETGVAMHRALEELLPLFESTMSYPTGTKMRQTATRLLELARRFDADVLPKELKTTELEAEAA